MSTEILSVLTSYLKEQKKKSFRGFLIRHRKILVKSSESLLTSSSCWKDLEDTWVTQFLKEAERLNLDQEAIKEKVRFSFFAK